MNDYTIFFDAENVDTPENLSPDVTISDAPNGVPVDGTGLFGKVYVPDRSIWSITRLKEHIEEVDGCLLYTSDAADD